MNVVFAIYKDLRLDYRDQVACLQLHCSQCATREVTKELLICIMLH